MNSDGRWEKILGWFVAGFAWTLSDYIEIDSTWANYLAYVGVFTIGYVVYRIVLDPLRKVQ